MIGADRAWAARYEVGDVLHYQRGSKTLGIEQRSYARVVSTDPKSNLLTVEKPDGQQVTDLRLALEMLARFEFDCADAQRSADKHGHPLAVDVDNLAVLALRRH